MKAILFTFVLLFGLGSMAQAQMREHFAERPEGGNLTTAQAEALTKLMTVQLQLNEAQVARLHRINSIKVSQADDIQWQFQGNSAQMQQALSELQSFYETECSRILTPSQLSLMRGQQPTDPEPKPDNQGGLG